MVLSVTLTVILAIGCALSRAGLNIVDRHMFGHLRISVPLGSVANNLLPGLIAAIGCTVGLPWATFLASFTNLGVIAFAFLAQLVALLFSYAFSKTTVPRTIVFSTLPNLFIPFGIWIITSKISPIDCLFSVATVIACAPVLLAPSANRNGFSRWPIALAIGITVQGSVSSTLLSTDGFRLSQWAAMIGCTVIWRLLFATMLQLGSLERSAHALCRLLREQRRNMLLRSTLAVLMQITFVLSIVGGHPLVSWPILNATPLFSAVAAASILSERPTRPESFACVLILLLALARPLVRL